MRSTRITICALLVSFNTLAARGEETCKPGMTSYCIDGSKENCPDDYSTSFEGCGYLGMCCYTERGHTPRPTKHSAKSQCGVPKFNPNARILGGGQTSIARHPWMAEIKVGRSHHCGASLISDRWLLTVAHCVDDKPFGFRDSQIKILVGSSNIVSYPGSKLYPISMRKLHPQYDLDTVSNDIALIKLSKAVDVINSEVTKAVCLPDTGETFDSQTCYVAGWGAMKESGSSPAELHAVDVTVHNKTSCKSHMGGHPGQLCAGHLSGGKDSCQGDSGGPLVCQDQSGLWTLAGVVSAGAGCGRKNYLGMYADVAFYRDWIVSTIDKYGR